MTVLLVEDDNAHAELVQRCLARELPGLTILRATTLHNARELLRSRPFDVVLLDYSLPDGNGLELFWDLRGRFRDIPVVFLTAANSAELCRTAWRGGAVDYIVKKRNYVDVLPLVVRKALSAGHSAVSGGNSISEKRTDERDEEPVPNLVERPGERSRIQTVLEQNHWHRGRAAQEPGVSRITLWRRMLEYGLLRRYGQSGK